MFAKENKTKANIRIPVKITLGYSARKDWQRTNHYFLSGGGGGTFLVKKLFTNCKWLNKICLLQGYEGKNLCVKQKEIF